MTESTLPNRMRLVEIVQAKNVEVIRGLDEVVTDHESRIRCIESLMPALKAVLWTGSALGLSIVGFVWALIVGQVQVTFP